MNRIFLPLVVVSGLALVFLGSCHKRDMATRFSEMLSLTKNTIILDGTSGSSDTFSIHSTLPWKASVSSAANWLQVDKTWGEPGNTVIRITVSSSSPITPTSVTITFSSLTDCCVQPVTLTVTVRPFNFNLAVRRVFGGSQDDATGRNSIARTADGGIIIAGSTNSQDGDIRSNHGSYDVWVVKLNSGGEIAWSRTYGGSGYDWASSVAETTDGNFVVTGFTNSNDGDVTGFHGGSGSDVWTLKLDSEGNVIWAKTFGGTSDDAARTVVATPGGGCALAGFASSGDGDVHGNHGGSDLWVLRLNSQGDTLWTASYGGSFWDEASHMTVTPDGGLALTGLTYSNDGDVSGYHVPTFPAADVWTIKLNANGKKIWTKTLGGSMDEVGISIVSCPTGGYLIAAYSQSNDGDIEDHHGNTFFVDIWLVKLDEDGNKIWAKNYGGSLDDGPTSVVVTLDGGYILTGGTASHDGDFSGSQSEYDNMFILKIKGNGNIEWSRKLGGSKDDIGYSVIEDSPGAYWLAGSTNSSDGDLYNSGYHGDYDLWAVRFVVQ